MSETSIFFKNAIDLADLIRKRELSAVEVMRAFLDRIAALNPKVNAICALQPEEALMAAAQKADEKLAGGQRTGPLHGLPLAVKDLALTRGIRTTFGSPIYKDFTPDQDQLFVERLKKAGAIIIGKTNTPEFGAGSHTFNPVYGITRNPYSLSRSAGGSSGGAAAALATGMLPLADGSDLGGSLRNPAGFCNVVGLRPSPGRVPIWPDEFAWQTLSVEGPMARTVKDLAFMLSIMAGPDPRSPISIDSSGAEFIKPFERDFKGVRIAWTKDLGRFPVEKAVARQCQKALEIFEDIGCEVFPDQPRTTGVFQAFQTLRAFSYITMRHDYEKNRSLMKQSVAWNIEKGLELSGKEVVEAEEVRTRFYQRVLRFLDEYEFLLLPSAQVLPFPVECEWVEEIEGVAMTTYIDWMAMNCIVSMTGLPAVSIPCGFSPQGLPVGLQIVGRHHRDFDVLSLAYAFESATEYYRIHPEL
jgi:amidase